jgi:phosphate transport system protein
MEIEIDEMALVLMARNQPTASDMRRLAATIKMKTDLERMGDLAAHIAERALSLMQLPRPELAEIPLLARLSADMVHDSLDALVHHDASLAEHVLLADDDVDHLRDKLYRSLIRSMEQDPAAVTSTMHLLFVVCHLERIADHATNIGEDVLFYLRGVDVRHRTYVFSSSPAGSDAPREEPDQLKA